MSLNKEDLLKSIALTGSVEESEAIVKVKINENLDNILDKSSGKLRLRPAKAKVFNSILSQPLELSALNPFEIRCLNCGRVISYPAWWMKIEFNVNTFHYFLCKESDSVKLECR